jgi:hypothetical protein
MRRAALAVLPVASYSKRNTVTPRCVSAAVLSRSRAECVEDSEAVATVVEAAAAERHGDTRQNPLASFDRRTYELAVQIASDFGIDEETVRVACARIVPASAPFNDAASD